ncbi:hypothetical protein [Bacteroides fragilis]|uniref:hypothetical protein n=1 Tax=Bacteroides fragilis TaxID=817 RepID=UPI001C702FBA|nr:hypothetical protein [Bacteroides fragilis]MBW9276483.1 hypothetical protein [Bacteroides fragilis]
MKQKHEFENIVAETLLIPLYMRAKESRRESPILLYFCEEQVRTFLHNITMRFEGGELWFDVCGTMMSRRGVKPDSLREHKAQIRSGIDDGHMVELWEPGLHLLEQANYMKFFRFRWGFFFGQILGRMTRLCYKFSSMLGYKIG